MEDSIKAYVLEPISEVRYWLIEGVGVIQETDDCFRLIDGTTQTFASPERAREFILDERNAVAVEIARQKTDAAKGIIWQNPEDAPSPRIG